MYMINRLPSSEDRITWFGGNNLIFEAQTMYLFLLEKISRRMIKFHPLHYHIVAFTGWT